METLTLFRSFVYQFDTWLAFALNLTSLKSYRNKNLWIHHLKRGLFIEIAKIDIKRQLFQLSNQTSSTLKGNFVSYNRSTFERVTLETDTDQRDDGLMNRFPNKLWSKQTNHHRHRRRENFGSSSLPRPDGTHNNMNCNGIGSKITHIIQIKVSRTTHEPAKSCIISWIPLKRLWLTHCELHPHPASVWNSFSRRTIVWPWPIRPHPGIQSTRLFDPNQPNLGFEFVHHFYAVHVREADKGSVHISQW